MKSFLKPMKELIGIVIVIIFFQLKLPLDRK